MRSGWATASWARTFFQIVTTCPSMSRPSAFHSSSRFPWFRSQARALALDVASRQPEQIDYSVVDRELGAVLDDLTQL